MAARATAVQRAFRAKHGVIEADVARLGAASGIALTEHLDDWKAAMVAKGDSENHASRFHRVAREVLVDGCSFQRLADIGVTPVDRYIGAQHGKKWKTGTCNHAVKAARAFGAWLELDDRVARNPLRRVHLRKADDAERRGAFSLDEVRKIVQAAEAGPTRYRMRGTERAMLYRLAVHTGIRAGGLRILTPECFFLDGSSPCLVLPHTGSKAKRREPKSLTRDFVEQLRPWLSKKEASRPVFDLPYECDLVRMLRKDMKVAGVPEINAAGEVRKFHSWRHTCITLATQVGGLIAGKKIAGHASASTTELYAHTDEEILMRAAAAIPVTPFVKGAAPALQPGGKTSPTESKAVSMANAAGVGSNPAENACRGGNSQMGRAGIEPATHGFSVHCSTN